MLPERRRPPKDDDTSERELSVVAVALIEQVAELRGNSNDDREQERHHL
jgi:hypothetical protein